MKTNLKVNGALETAPPCPQTERGRPRPQQRAHGVRRSMQSDAGWSSVIAVPGDGHAPASSLLTTAALVLLTAAVAFGQNLTQTLTLQSGWNAVYLNVAPSDTSPTAVFAGLPVASAWTRAEPLSSAQFIQDPSEAAFNAAEWLRWVPNQPSFVSSLRVISGHRAYLLKLTNGPVSWTVTGQPALRPARWSPDSYNLRAFPVDPATPPTFKAFLKNSAAHYDALQDRPRGIYRLNSLGQWVTVDKNDAIGAGIAYWVYCQGASTFSAPLDVSTELGNGLDFGKELERITLRLENLGDGPRTVTLRQAGAVTPGVLAWQRLNATNGFEWIDLPNPFSLTVSNGVARQLPLAIRRSRMPGTSYASLLEVTDGQAKQVLPVKAERFGLGYAGLWVGSVTVNAVSEPHFGSVVTNRYAMVNGQATPLSDPGLNVITNRVVSTNLGALVTNEFLIVRTSDGAEAPVYEKAERSPGVQTPTSTRSEFGMRLLIHVDGTGRANLLKEVIQMWRDGTYTNDAQGAQVSDKPGTFVLLTREDLFGQFKGATLRDGTSVGRRLGAIGFDFDSRGTNHMALSGTFAPGHSLTGLIHLASDYPLNPFRHKYHPDHDNLDAEFAAITDDDRAESYAVTRALNFDFAAAAAPGTSPDPAYSVMEGVYSETMTGLHKQPIQVQGTFRLSRASFIAELNPNPTP